MPDRKGHDERGKHRSRQVVPDGDTPPAVILAKARIQETTNSAFRDERCPHQNKELLSWIPTCAGMTKGGNSLMSCLNHPKKRPLTRTLLTIGGWGEIIRCAHPQGAVLRTLTQKILRCKTDGLPPVFFFVPNSRPVRSHFTPNIWKKRPLTRTLLTIGGWGEIRTHGGVTPTPVFKTGALNHFGLHP